MEGSAVEDEREEGGGFGLRLEETELRLGLPGGDSEPVKSGGKRGFSETIDLKLKLGASLGHGDGAGLTADDWKKKDEDHEKIPASKAQVVGWPPVRSFRKNILSEKTTRSSKKEDGEKPGGGGGGGAAMVKVSMDGAPYLRKVDLKTCSSYKELSEALEAMFRSFTGGKCGPNARDFLNEGKLMDLLDGSKYVPTYEDGDGDWMLVGDVPWEMFVVSCRRLRIIHSSEAVGLAPRAMEKQRSRS